MDPNSATSLTTLLAPIFGVKTAGIVSLITAAIVVLSQIMPALPVADASSSSWYRVAYGIAARLTGSWRNNSPMPPSGNPAGGIVPVPPIMKDQTHA